MVSRFNLDIHDIDYGIYSVVKNDTIIPFGISTGNEEKIISLIATEYINNLLDKKQSRKRKQPKFVSFDEFINIRRDTNIDKITATSILELKSTLMKIHL